MKKRISTVLIILVFFVGLLVLLYPTISNWYNEKMNSHVVSNYTDVIDNTNEEDFAKILQDARAYNQKLHSLPKEFIAGKPESQEYIDSLNVYKGMMGYIEIESLGVKMPISHGTDEDVLQTQVGHLEGSSLPTGDIGNNTVLTGHTGLPSAELFTNLSKMKIGDTFKLSILNEEFTYKVYNTVVVLPYQVDDLEPVEGKDIVTLITCTPYGVNSHRLLVQGEQIEVPEEEIVIEDNNIKDINFVKLIPIIVAPIIIILLILIIISHKRDKKYRDSH